MTNNLSWCLHYGKLCQKAYNALHLIKRSLPKSAPVYLKKNNCISPLSAPTSLIAHAQIWKSQYVNNISCLERIHRRSTKYILNDYTLPTISHGSEHSIFSDSPMAWSAWSLVSQDQENSLEIYRYITFRTTCTRTGLTGHMLNINYTRTSAVRHFYFNRIVLLWNSVQPAINLNEPFQVIMY